MWKIERLNHKRCVRKWSKERTNVSCSRRQRREEPRTSFGGPGAQPHGQIFLKNVNAIWYLLAICNAFKILVYEAISCVNSYFFNKIKPSGNIWIIFISLSQKNTDLLNISAFVAFLIFNSCCKLCCRKSPAEQIMVKSHFSKRLVICLFSLNLQVCDYWPPMRDWVSYWKVCAVISLSEIWRGATAPTGFGINQV